MIPEIVCLDSHGLIWGVQQTAREGQEEMIDRTLALLQSLDERNAVVTTTAVSLAEFLVGVPEENIPALTEVISQRFLVYPLDTAAAFHAAAIRRKHTSRELRENIPDYVRNNLMPDCQIVGIALSRQVKTIYSHDPGVLYLAQSVGIEALDIPELEIEEPMEWNLPEILPEK